MKKSSTFLMLISMAVLLLQAQTIQLPQDHRNDPPDFIPHMIDADSRGVNSLCTADLDGDGDPDIVVGSDYSNEITGWINLDLGSGNFFSQLIEDAFEEVYSLSAADMNRDGDPDILGGNYFGDEIAWWENIDASTFQKHTIDSLFPWAQTVQMIDFDFDGDQDVLAASKLNNDIVWYENDGSQNFTSHLIEGSFISVNSIDAIDMEGDGDIDLIGSNGSSIAWWENVNYQEYTMHPVASGLSLGIFVTVANLVQYEGSDVIGVDKYGNTITRWVNDGSHAFTGKVIDDDIKWPNHVFVSDLDNDNDSDLLAVSSMGNYLCWYENQGSGNFMKRMVQEGLSGACQVVAADLDLDGDMDIVATAENSGEIYWWENNLISVPQSLFPELVFEPDKLEFQVGQDGAGSVLNAQLTIQNLGSATLLVQDITCHASWIADIDTCSFTLLPETSLTVTVECDAGDLYNGIYSDVLTILSNDPDSPELEVDVVLEMQGGQEAHFITESEPDNEPSQANPIYGPSPSGVMGTISVEDQGSIDILGDDVEDLYQFTLLSGPLKIKLFDTSADLDLSLLKIEGISTTIYGTNHRGAATDEVYENSELEPGVYYAGVSIYDPYPIRDESGYSLVVEGDIFINVGIPGFPATSGFNIERSYPNPFHLQTTLEFSVVRHSRVTIRVLDATGRAVRTLVDGYFDPGTHTILWDGRDQSGTHVGPGVYFYSMESGYSKVVKRVILQR